MHNYFTHNPKRHLETSKLVILLECKSNKILKNIKTYWISMLSPLKKVLAENKVLVVKMIEDNATNAIAKLANWLNCWNVKATRS